MSSPGIQNITLPPAWPPIAAPGISVADQAAMLPIAVSDDGVLVAGSQKRLHVFRVGSNPRLWFSIAAHASLSGYALAGGVLYLQDGPVLSVWDVTTVMVSPGQQEATGICLAAINLITGSKAGAAGAAGLSDTQYAALFAGTSGSARSAPVARVQQLGGPAGAMVFVLAADGSVYAADDALSQVTTARYDPPGPLALGLSETANVNDPSQVTCTLAYVTKPGGIAVFEAPGVVLQPAGAWPPFGTGPAPVTGPQFVGGTVWACDVFGSAAAACPLPPPTAPVFQAPAASPPAAAQGLEVSTTRQLALLNGSELRLLAFAPGTTVVDRWPAGSVAGPAWAMFWEPPGDPATQPGLVLTVEKAAAAGDVAFTVIVANTQDRPPVGVSYIWPFQPYPPPPAGLVTGTLTLAPPGSRRASAVLVCQVISQEQLYALVTDDTGAALLGAWPLTEVAKTALPAAAAELQRLALLDTAVQFTVIIPATIATIDDIDKYQIGGSTASTLPFFIDGFGRAWLDFVYPEINLGQSGPPQLACRVPGWFWGQTITGEWHRADGSLAAQGSVLATPGTPLTLTLEITPAQP